MDNSYSLIQMLKSDNEDFTKRFSTKISEVKSDKKNLLKAADEYAVKYSDEINEGTVKKQLLISDGYKQGKSKDEILQSLSVFIPSRDTPILNMLHFLLHEYDSVSESVQFNRDPDYKDNKFNDVKTQLNKKFGSLNFDDIEQDIPEILEYVYENVTTEIFKKIKKLKALSKSSNKEEAFSAYSKCVELCKKYKLDFDKIPCNVE